jgi:hypothetical protein
MNYSPQELEYIEKLMRRLERESKQWPWLRWLILPASILLVAVAAHNFILLQNLLNTLTSAFSLPKEYNPARVSIL